MKAVTLRKYFMPLLWLLVIFFSSYYIWANCLRYFIFDPKHYHYDFFWLRKYWLFIHVVSGMIATIAAPFQFIPALRIKNIQVHKFLGRVYVYSVILSALTSLYLCATTPEGLVYALGLTGFTIVWLLTVVIGMINAIEGNITRHREWMTRSFVVTIGFSVSRLLEDLITHATIHVERVDRVAVLAWVSWIVPLVITEWILSRNKNKFRKNHGIVFTVKAATGGQEYKSSSVKLTNKEQGRFRL